MTVHLSKGSEWRPIGTWADKKYKHSNGLKIQAYCAYIKVSEASQP